MIDLYKQIEAAFNYRGHVTINFKNGDAVDGYLYNRDLKSENPFIEVFLKGNAEPRSYKIDELTRIELTGIDEAEGKSYQDWLEKKATEKNNVGP